MKLGKLEIGHLATLRGPDRKKFGQGHLGRAEWGFSTASLGLSITVRYPDIKRHLKPYVIVAQRKTTINHAFAAAVAPCDEFDEQRVRKAIACLGQDPDSDLYCVYCGATAETWDHVFAIVQDSRFSGHGHRLGNLPPCCKPCNSKKGNRDWKQYLEALFIPPEVREKRITTIQLYLDSFLVPDVLPEQLAEYKKLQEIKNQIITLMAQADVIAQQLREREERPNPN